MDGCWLQSHPISSPGAFGSGELKMQQSVPMRIKIQTMNTLMKPMHFICGNIEFLDFSKFLSHMTSYHREKHFGKV